MEKAVITNSARETEKAGEELGNSLKIGDIVVITGNLGAGKTTFVQGIAKAFSIKSRVISPTFILVRKHRGKKNDAKVNLYHIDLYRLEADDIESLGLADIFEDVNGIFVFEWGEKSGALRANWKVDFEISEDHERKIRIKDE